MFDNGIYCSNQTRLILELFSTFSYNKQSALIQFYWCNNNKFTQNINIKVNFNNNFHRIGFIKKVSCIKT